MALGLCDQKRQVPLPGEGNAVCCGWALLKRQRGRLGLSGLGKQERELAPSRGTHAVPPHFKRNAFAALVAAACVYQISSYLSNPGTFPKSAVAHPVLFPAPLPALLVLLVSLPLPFVPSRWYAGCGGTTSSSLQHENLGREGGEQKVSCGAELDPAALTSLITSSAACSASWPALSHGSPVGGREGKHGPGSGDNNPWGFYCGSSKEQGRRRKASELCLRFQQPE